MKLLISTPILILLTLLSFAKLDGVNGAVVDESTKKKKGKFDIPFTIFSIPFVPGLIPLTIPGVKKRRRRLAQRTHLVTDENFWSSSEVETCLEDTYDTKLYFDDGHLFLLASPESKDSSCPIIAIDNGFTDEDDSVLVPLVSVPDEVPAGGLSLDHSVTLGSLARVVSHLDTDAHTIDMDRYSIVDNNCASFILYLFDKIRLDYGEPEINTSIVNYVGKSLTARKSTINAIQKAYLEENTGTFQQAKFHVWRFLVGDEGMTHALVRNYMNERS
jgi:hypothetical protein